MRDCCQRLVTALVEDAEPVALEPEDLQVVASFGEEDEQRNATCKLPPPIPDGYDLEPNEP